MDGDQLLAPRARTHNLVVRELDGELIIFDRTSNVGHRLLAEVAATWKRCDGETTVAEIAAAASSDLGSTVSEEAIWRHLVQLGELGLLEAAASIRPARNRFSRKSMLVKAGAVAAVGVGLPLITSIPAARAFSCNELCDTSIHCTDSACPCCGPSGHCDNGHGNCH